jgi:uncharacterized cupredoxin-like copper-binding protein
MTLAGCGGKPSGREIALEVTSFQFTPASVEVKAGEQVQFVLTNKSDTDHEFESTEGKFEEIVVPAGKSRTAAWTAPAKTGEYEFECDMTGHQGMHMTVKVTN